MTLFLNPAETYLRLSVSDSRWIPEIPAHGLASAFSAPPSPVRFSVYLNAQNVSTDESAHTCSRELANRIVAGGDGFRIGQNAIKLRQGKTFKEMKAKYERRKLIGKLLPEATHYLPYNYPLPYEFLKAYQ